MGNPEIVLPDFDDMMVIAGKISQLALDRDMLEIKIKRIESDIYKTTATDTAYYVGGKPPSASFVKAAYEFTGLQGELISLREEYAKTCSSLDYNRLLFETMKMQVDLYRTESANRRHTGL